MPRQRATRKPPCSTLMRQRYDHVSAERVLSGPGLVNLYNALCELGGQPSAGFTAAQITDPKTMAEDALRLAVRFPCSAPCSAPSPAIWR